MGLTLHYQFAAGTRPLTDVRHLIESLRQKALALPFANVSEIIELEGEDCRLIPGHHDDPHPWLKVQTIRFLLPNESETPVAGEIPPLHIIAFTIDPGDGSEPANVGLCRYPSTVTVNEQKTPTGLEGWSWSSFCKTQYASNPTLGGMDNFLKAHMGIVALLDYAKELGILEVVKDEGGYWENRNVAALIKTVGEWNAMVAGAYGIVRDAVEKAGGDPRGLEAEITKFSDFERLEAKGRKK